MTVLIGLRIRQLNVNDQWPPSYDQAASASWHDNKISANEKRKSVAGPARVLLLAGEHARVDFWPEKKKKRHRKVNKELKKREQFDKLILEVNYWKNGEGTKKT